MNVACPECRSVFRVDPAKVPPSGVDVRCSVCGSVFGVGVDAQPARTGTASVGEHRSDVRDDVRTSSSAATVAPAVQERGAAEPDQRWGSALDGVTGTAAADDPGRGDREEGAINRAPRSAASDVPQPVESRDADASAISDGREPASAASGFHDGSVGSTGDGGIGRVSSSPAAAPSPAMGGVEAPPVPAAPASSQQPENRPRPVNPYLNNSPELRARRLARALVSDLVAYNPQKREQGLRDGTLRQLFRDEIRKSWEEYVEQVGANVAENTPHFQDALNDVLAGGRRVF